MRVFGDINTQTGGEINTTPAMPSISSNTLVIDCSTANIFVVNQNANINTLTVKNQNDGQTIVIFFYEVSSGYTITWPGSFTFIGSNVIDAVTGQINLLRATYSAALSTWVAILDTNLGGSGTVTSVALADGSSFPIYGITGSPVTGSGTLTFSLGVQNANTVFAGPASGPSTQPTFRALTTADLPENTYEAQTAANYAVVSTTSSTFVVTGDQTAIFVSGYTFIVSGSSGGANDATWTVTSSTYASGPNHTTINVTGSVATGLGVNGTIEQTVFNTTNVTTLANTSTNTFIEVFVNGVYQEQGSSKAYTVTGANQITFTYGLSLNSDVVFIGLI